jgi:hypothetical protein
MPIPKQSFIAPGWRCDPAKALPDLRPVIEAAVGEIGAHEDPPDSNQGALIDKYGARGQKWCGYFVSWCFAKMPGGSPFGVKASALKLHNWAKANRRVLGQTESLRAGDVGLVLHADGSGHVILIADILEGGRLACVEGNWKDAVRATVRARSDMSAVVRARRYLEA